MTKFEGDFYDWWLVWTYICAGLGPLGLVLFACYLGYFDVNVQKVRSDKKETCQTAGLADSDVFTDPPELPPSPGLVDSDS